jgi:hypothetical protein
VVILQPSYLPWLGYFEQIFAADHFVFLDDVQFDKHGWRNRNRILLGSRPHWLTVPVVTKGRPLQQIREVQIANDQDWARRHLLTLHHAYSHLPGFGGTYTLLASLLNDPPPFLSELNVRTVVAAARSMGASCEFHLASQISKSSDRNQRLIDICRHLGASHYTSGEAARSYLDESLFRDHGIEVRWHEHDARAYGDLNSNDAVRLSFVHYACSMGLDELGQRLRDVH